MLMEIFIHVAHIEDMRKYRPINCKINYASQYDVRFLINPNKYVIIPSKGSNNVVTIRRKTILDYLGIRKFFK